MAREVHPPAPVLVAQRMCDLLQSFPAAAVGGVQWQTLAQKYEDRYCSRLDVKALGHCSALAAATALLWEVLRLVESVDTDNPVVALEDGVVLTPRPNSLASWPSLYQVFCELVLNPDRSASGGTNEILLSQLKPLLQKHWHANFDESGLSYLTEEGSPVKLKKMKHLVHAVLRWREQRASWRAEAGARPTALDEALRPELELVPSKRHNDLVLRMVAGPMTPEVCVVPPLTSLVGLCAPAPARGEETPGNDTESWPEDAESLSKRSSTGSSVSVDLAQELESLRAENARLRASNELLESRVQDAALSAALFRAQGGHAPPPLEAELFDSPFEPPPEIRHQGLAWGCGASPLASTVVQSSFSLSSGSPTPWSQASSSHPQSGSATPAGFGTGGNQVCALVPVWFPLGDRGEIPSGVVQQVRAVFERGGEALPSFFTQR